MAGRYERADWQETVEGDELRRAQRGNDQAMHGVIAEVQRGNPIVPLTHSEGGEPCVNGVPERVLKQIEAAERARLETAKAQEEWEDYRRKQQEEWRAAKAAEPWLTWDAWIKRKEKKD